MRYNKIRKMDISNGPGIRISVFMQGCPFHCEGCFNPETWDFDGGKEFSDETINHIIELCGKEHISGLSILGGEPLHKDNIDGTTKLAKAFKEKYPNKTLWIWTGNLFESLKNKEILKYADTIVDGQFKIELSSPLLKWKGSSNQRVIDVKKSVKEDKVVLYETEEFEGVTA
ncbi:MAG: anaerobic ribonucleoside-triphosphate reductase activating protein [Bacilli bacterium]|nr:anaerobic ribonucleoside-triphosphate reductase activating protein [Bacilli bacterium]